MKNPRSLAWERCSPDLSHCKNLPEVLPPFFRQTIRTHLAVLVELREKFCSCSIHRAWTVNLRTSGAPSGLRWLPDKPGGHDQSRTVCPATKQVPEPQNPTAPKQATGLEAGT